jgi:ubiquinone/menaquinone biosynthesis C-methylase UbiE
MKKSIYDEQPFGEFNYDRDEIYKKDMLGSFFLERIRNKKIADIGTGRGFLLDFLVKNGIPRKNLYGCDLSEESVKECVKKGYNVRVDDNTSLSYSSDSFDAVISNGVIHHTKNYIKSFRELVRITKPDGLIYLSVYSLLHFYPLFYFLCSPLRFLYHRISRNLVDFFFFPLFRFLYFYPVIKVLTKTSVDSKTAKTLFYDQILTPVARFRTPRTIKRYISRSGCELLKFGNEKGGQMITFVFRKRSDSV